MALLSLEKSEVSAKINVIVILITLVCRKCLRCSRISTACSVKQISGVPSSSRSLSFSSNVSFSRIAKAWQQQN